MEAEAIATKDSVLTQVDGEFVVLWPPLEGEAKENLQSMEHTLFSIFMLMDRSKVFSKSMLLYEVSKSDMDIIPGHDMKVWLQMIRGFIYFDHDLLYLSEKEYSDNLNWLYDNPEAELPMTSTIFYWAPLFTGEFDHRLEIIPNDAAYTMQLLVNHTLRAMTRLSMDRPIDEERAMMDFEAIVNTAHGAGLQNEIIWSIEAYLYMHQEKSEEAIVSLKKLRGSEFLTDEERKTIDEAIGFLENREPESALNGVYDKYFLNKILIKYLYQKGKQQDWIKILKELGIIKNDDLMLINAVINDLLEKVEKETSTEALKEKGNELKEEGKKLLKDLLE